MTEHINPLRDPQDRRLPRIAGPSVLVIFGVTGDLLTHAEIGKDAVLVGSLTKFAIWSPARWQKLETRTSGEHLGDLMRRIGI